MTSFRDLPESEAIPVSPESRAPHAMVEGLFYETFALMAKYPGSVEGSPPSFSGRLTAEELDDMTVMDGFGVVTIEAHPAYDHETNPDAVNMLVYSFYEKLPEGDVLPDSYVLFEETGTRGNGKVDVHGDKIARDGTLSEREVEELYFIGATMATANMPPNTLSRMLGQAAADRQAN